MGENNAKFRIILKLLYNKSNMICRPFLVGFVSQELCSGKIPYILAQSTLFMLVLFLKNYVPGNSVYFSTEYAFHGQNLILIRPIYCSNTKQNLHTIVHKLRLLLAVNCLYSYKLMHIYFYKMDQWV